MLEVGCRICKRRVTVPPRDGVYKCRCQEVSVRVTGPTALINEFTKGCSIVLK